MLVVFSGLPGAGKSAVAESLGGELGAPILSVDPIEAAIWRCGIPRSFETGVAAYEVAAVLAEQQLRLGLTVIADAVNSVEVARAMWRRAADNARGALRVVEIVCTDAELHRSRLEKRTRNIDGFPEPTWEEVLQRRAEWEEWTDDRLVLDSVDPLSTNVARAMAYIAT